MPDQQYEYHLFISHASEDKDGIVRPLAEALRQTGLHVWYDEFTLRLGDNLRQSIDHGLTKSAYGVVVLSEHFFNKRWPQRELDGLTALETSDGRRRIIPIWHGVGQAEVAQYSPPLANIIAGNTSDGIDRLVNQISDVVNTGWVRLEDFYEYIHEGERIDIVALARESGQRIEGHYFKDCELVGPAVLGVIDQVTFVNQILDPVQMWSMQPRGYIGGIPLRRSRFENVTFDGIGFAAAPDVINLMFYQAPWVPPAPPGA